MRWELNVHTTLAIPRLAMKILGCYPIQKEAGRGAYVTQKLCWWCSMASTINAVIWLGYNMVKANSDINDVLNTSPEMSLVLSLLGKQLICMLYNDELRDVVNEFERFLKESPRTTIDYLNRELRLIYIAHAILIFGCIADPLVFSTTPLVDGRPLPAHTHYPWSLDSTAPHAIMYATHVICAVTLSCMSNMDVVFSTLLWCAVVRFRYLNSQLSQAREVIDTREYAAEQQRLIKYAKDLANISRWMACVIVTEIFYMVTTGGVLLLRKPPLFQVLIYSMMTLDGSLELLLYCWAADNLYDASKDVGYSAFQCDWYGKSKEMALNLRLIMQRCQQPVTISSPGLLPVLSREFFGSIMSTTFSYIATLRVVSDSQ